MARKVEVNTEERKKGQFPRKKLDNHKSLACRICGKAGHKAKDYRFKCKRCRNPTHSERNCWYKNKDDDHEANYSEEHDDRENMFTAV